MSNLTEKELVDKMTNAFLQWKLPDSVCADGCATIHNYKNRVGTNLLTYTEASKMFTEVVLPLMPKRTEAALTKDECRRLVGEILNNTSWGYSREQIVDILVREVFQGVPRA